MIAIQKPDGTKKGLILRGIMSGGVSKGIIAGSILTPDGSKTIWDGSVGALTVTTSPTSVYGALPTSTPGSSAPVVTNAVAVSVTGGSAPFSYAWTLVSDDGLGGVWSALTPSDAVTSFRASAVLQGTPTNATFRCTVTDARGATGTVDVTAGAILYYYGGY